MARPVVKHLAVIVLVALASAAIVAVLLGGVLQVAVLEKTPAHYLPASRTLALLTAPDDAMMDRFEPWFPGMSALPGPLQAIAFVSLPDGQNRTVGFMSQVPVPASLYAKHVGPFIAVAIDDDVLGSVGDQPARLWDDRAFRTIAAAEDPRMPWVFVNRKAVPEPVGMLGRLVTAAILKDASSFGIREKEDEAVLSFYQPHERAGQPLALPRLEQNRLLLAFSVVDIRGIVQETLAATGDHRIGWEGRMKQLRKEWLADGVSIDFDLLPALSGAVAGVLERGESGQTLFSVTAAHADAEKTARTLDRMHEGYRSILPSVSARVQRFDDRFVSSVITIDDAKIVHNTALQNGWQVRTTRATGASHGLFTALSPRFFIVANTEEVLQKRITERRNDSVLPRPGSTLRGAGWMRKDEVLALFKNGIPPSSDETPSPLLSLFPEEFVWALEQNGPLTTLTVRRNADPGNTSIR